MVPRRRSPEYKETVKLSLYKRGISRKIEIINLKGGKCSRCGYNKCIHALSFHHRDKTDKLFSLGINNLWSKSMKAILEEVEKCDLVCLNCHAEIEQEYQKSTNPNGTIKDRVNKKYGTNF